MIHAQQAHLHVAAQSNMGKVRQNNEDSFAVSAYRLSETDPTPSVFAILCDGIGGHKAGEVASEMAVNRITAWVARSDGTRPQRRHQIRFRRDKPEGAGRSSIESRKAWHGCDTRLRLGDRPAPVYRISG